MTRRIGILVVDDSEPLGRMLVQALERNGYRARWAASDVDALAAVRDDPPDAVLVDLNLGDRDGSQLARTLRTLPGMQATRIIGLSGDPPRRRHRASFDAFLLKPVALQDLLDTLRT